MNTSSVTISDLGRIVTGKTPSTKNPVFFDGAYQFVTPSDLDWKTYYCRSTERTVTDDARKLIHNQFIPANAVMVTCIGNTIGKCGIASGDCLTNQQINSIIPQDGIDSKFVYYLIIQNIEVIRGVGLGGGSATPILNKTSFSRVKLSVPPENRWFRIASILSAYDDLIENNRRRIQLLEHAARLLYKEWFVHFRFPGHEHVKIKNGVPEGWEKRHLSKIFDTQYGFTESATDDPVGPKFLRGTDINKTSYIDWSTVPFCPDQKLDFQKYRLQIDDILVIRMADPGKVAIVETEVKAVFASYLIRLTRKPGVDIPALYLFYVLADDQYQGFISGASGGATRKSASAKLVVDFSIQVPPMALSHLFVSQVQPIREQIQTLLQKNAKLAAARDLLLPRLMNGEIVV